MTQKKNYSVPFIIITTLFFLWGFITVLVDSLVPRLKDVFELSYFQAGMVQSAFFAAYFVFSIPAGSLLSKIGYKNGIFIGLLTMATGCFLFYPASSIRSFPIFLIAYFTLAAGITILQVAANPYVAVLGSEDGASSRLNLSQAFNSLGTAIAPAFGAAYLLSDKILSSSEIKMLSTQAQEEYYLSEAIAVQDPFLIFGGVLAVLALIFLFLKLPVIQKNKSGGYLKVLKNPKVLKGALGIFVYVGAEVAIGSYLVNYFISLDLAELIKSSSFLSSIASTQVGEDLYSIDNKAIVGAFVFLYWSAAMIGRFLGSVLMRFFAPNKVLLVFTLTAVALICMSISNTGTLAMFTILAVGLCNSIMFPTVFTLTLDGLGDSKPQASGIMCTAIVGGAVIPVAFGKLVDTYGFTIAFLLPMLCYLYIAFFALGQKISLKTI
ncbi:glucose/galactose MFS transporter [Nonlabens spongiae]|uniref:Glucose/galactose MFS transporter n=1 Tax=Nonlabens spongiae TaxID=331648 RepID=A0A1W6MKA6_9FLAO|nr:sugar MFS transporter [Nonlabens spongiae]ARN78054.1 glucose/galactose MFS transporter [Nonlabens spongiae]